MAKHDTDPVLGRLAVDAWTVGALAATDDEQGPFARLLGA
jgi:hypothetical protein